MAACFKTRGDLAASPMKKLLIILLPVVLMAGCAAELISADANTVTVKGGNRNMGDAKDIAENECQKRGNHARLTGRPAENRLVFDCVR